MKGIYNDMMRFANPIKMMIPHQTRTLVSLVIRQFVCYQLMKDQDPAPSGTAGGGGWGPGHQQ